MEQIISTKEAAKILNVTPIHIRRLINRGEIKAIRIGDRVWAVSLSSVQDYQSKKKN